MITPGQEPDQAQDRETQSGESAAEAAIVTAMRLICQMQEQHLHPRGVHTQLSGCSKQKIAPICESSWAWQPKTT